jgi:UDP-N-acetyl-2-amino-2-deoxyglucuronate dehydrogenase
VRFGLVGCGGISTQHIEAMNAVDGAQLVAVTSASSERARATGETWGVPWTAGLEELLARDDVDAITVTTPSGFHAEIALAALRRGKHVIVEKPLALSVADADGLIAEGRRQGRLIATVSQRRFEPVMQALRRAVVAGGFGRIALVMAESLNYRPQSYYDSAAWRGTRALDGGVLMNQAIHEVDLVCWLGGPVSSVAAHVATLGHQMEAEDAATVSLRFASGGLGEIVATTCATPGFEQEVRIYGDAGHARIVGELPVEWVVPGIAAPTPEMLDPGIDPATLSAPTWGTDSIGHTRQYADFVGAIRAGRQPAISGEDGRRAVEVVTAAYESDRTGRTVVLSGRGGADGAGESREASSGVVSA